MLASSIYINIAILNEVILLSFTIIKCSMSTKLKLLRIITRVTHLYILIELIIRVKASKEMDESRFIMVIWVENYDQKVSAQNFKR